ncbi:MAG: LemA family protein [Phycisphaerae bacterium]|jgi:LemA protein|nr:LemA family protein [Phycisphaerae bacterium]
MGLQTPLIITGMTVLFFVIWIMVTYNMLIRIKELCSESWADIDTELRRRYDLIPNLVSAVKGYADHERKVLRSVIEARDKAKAAAATLETKTPVEKALTEKVRQLLALSEKYPDLKASENFLELQSALVDTEDRIQAARRFYNANVREINTQIEVFPSKIIAQIFHITGKEFFEIEDARPDAPPAVDMETS